MYVDIPFPYVHASLILISRSLFQRHPSMESIVLCGLVSRVVAVVGEILDGTSGRRDRMVVLVIVVVLVVTTTLLVDTDIFLTAKNRHDVCILSRQDLVEGAIVLPINDD